MLTDQQVFDRIAENFRKRTKCARRDDNPDNVFCVYRVAPDSVGYDPTNPENNCCGIGAIIPDENYGPWLEGNGVEDIPGCMSKITTLPVSCLQAIQSIHDRMSMSKWNSAEGLEVLKKVATRYGCTL